MMPRPVAHYLVHFESLANMASRSEPSPDDSGAEHFEDEKGADPEAAIRVAREEGFVEGTATAGKEWQAQLAQERQAFEMRLAAERENWAHEESEKLAEKIQAAFAEIESYVAGCVARILKPMVIDAARAKIVGLLTETIGVLLRGQNCPALAIAGPEDLLTALRERLSPLSAAFEYSFNESVDVRVRVGETMIESQLAQFAARLEANGE
jgi:hypothetical protein